MNLARMIDHTLLKPESTLAQIHKLCQEARDHHFFSVCVNSTWVTTAVAELKGSEVKTVAVIGFPLGAMATAAKAFEADWCVRHGAAEIDMVINLGALKDRNLDLVEQDIASVVKAAAGAPVKVILETGLLTQEEKRLACQAAVRAQAHFVKTCTGFSVGSATAEDVQLMRQEVGPQMGVKASGGIKSAEQAELLIEAGADRLGTSSGVALSQGKNSAEGY